MEKYQELFLKLYGISLNKDDIEDLKADSQFNGIKDNKTLNNKIINWLKTRPRHSDIQKPDVGESSQLFDELRKIMGW